MQEMYYCLAVFFFCFGFSRALYFMINIIHVYKQFILGIYIFLGGGNINPKLMPILVSILSCETQEWSFCKGGTCL